MATDETGRGSHGQATTRSRMEALIAAMRRPAPAPAPATYDDDRLAAAARQAMQRDAAAGEDTIDLPPAEGIPTLDHGTPAGARRRERAAIELGGRLGRYMPIEELGRGGMGRVLRAYDPKLQREVALKLLNPEVVDGLGGARMVREARSMAQLRHPNVVAVYDVEDDPRHGVMLVMELVEGCTLREWLRQRGRAWPEVLRVFLEAGRGLAAAHQVGIKVFCDVTDLQFAQKVEALGADALIAVNNEAGGHRGHLSPQALIDLLKQHTTDSLGGMSPYSD